MFEIGKLVNSIDTLLKLNTEFPLAKKREYQNKTWRSVEYVNLPISFDIEVSSFLEDDYGNTYSMGYYNQLNREQKRTLLKNCEPRSVMYIWQFGINGNVTVGRTWEEFESAMKKVCKHFKLGANRRLPVYVHNLSYEFQFIRKKFEWESIFGREARKPMKALASNGIEFRCSYMLSGSSLEQTCKDLAKYKVEKKVGDLAYDVLRTPLTRLTPKEIGYAVYDVIGVMCYIQEQIEQYGDVTKLPMTNTGRVREYCREKCFDEKNGNAYRKLMSSLTITDLEEYEALKRAFQGGFTHAGWLNARYTHINVKSFDFTSSYPTVMVAEKFPMSKAETGNFIKTVEDLKRLQKGHCIMFNVFIDGLRPKFKYDHYISESKCYIRKGVKTDNGRVISADKIALTITDVDFDIIEQAYEWDKIEFGKCWVYNAEYLPTPLVECILDFYKDKTTLKDVIGEEVRYLLRKGMLNSCYGMTVTDIINDIIEYIDNEWVTSASNAQEELDKYNKSKKRFLYYPWGVWVTAYARRNLWSGIFECGSDYIYSDTDSIKILNYESHLPFIENYNKWITNKLTKACEYHKIDVGTIAPLTVKGKVKPLGVWDDDGDYRRFKTLGAKRYLVEHFNEKEEKWELKCTIAGVNKDKTSEWFMEDYDNAFENFNDLMEVPQEYSGRLVVNYVDEATEGTVIDDNGVEYNYYEDSGIFMRGSEYNLTMTELYIMLLDGREEVESI